MSSLPLKADMGLGESMQTELQTNHAAQHGIVHHKLGYRIRNAEQEHTLSTTRHKPGCGILELENHCSGNPTEGSNPSLSASATDLGH